MAKTRWLVLSTATLTLFLWRPSPALAHGIGGRTDLPLPLEYFIVGGGVVLVLTFVALAALWPEPRLQGGPRVVATAPGPPRRLLRIIGVLALALVIGQLVVPGLDLVRDPTRATIAPVTVWVLFWLVVPFLSAFVGNWYADLNPWRALAKGFGLGRGERRGLTSRLGVWPATIAFLAFTWLELVSPGSGQPDTLAVAAVVYTVYLLVAMAVAGRETGLLGFDAFTTYNRLFSAISPLGRDARGRLVWRGWVRSLPVVPEWSGLWVFVIVMLGTVSYDGAAGTDWFRVISVGLGGTLWGETILLVASVVLIGLAYLGACALAERLGGHRFGVSVVAQRFAHTLVPIALAYAFAHYFTLIIFEGQQLLSALSDPFGLGWDLFGSAERRIQFFVTTTDPVWYIQVASIVAGHVLGVVLAHDRALADYGRDAVRSQYAMLILMVGLTSLGLAILAG